MLKSHQKEKNYNNPPIFESHILISTSYEHSALFSNLSCIILPEFLGAFCLHY